MSHLNALKSMTEEGLFSDSASKDWAESVIKLLEEQTKKTKQKSELQKNENWTKESRTEQTVYFNEGN